MTEIETHESVIEDRDPAMELRVLINALARTSMLPHWAERSRLEALWLVDKIDKKEEV